MEYLTSHSAVVGSICMSPILVSLVFLSYRIARGCLSLSISATARSMSYITGWQCQLGMLQSKYTNIANQLKHLEKLGSINCYRCKNQDSNPQIIQLESVQISDSIVALRKPLKWYTTFNYREALKRFLESWVAPLVNHSWKTHPEK